MGTSDRCQIAMQKKEKNLKKIKLFIVLLDLINLICFYRDNDYYETSLQTTVLNANLVITISQSEL